MPNSFSITRRVAFAETDMAGIMHFANYFRMMEDVEHAFFRSLGLSVSMQHDQKHIGWPRVSAKCDFSGPVRFEDELELRLRVVRVGSKSFTYMKYAIIIPDGAADEPLAELGGKTPLEAAHTPNMDRIAIEGRQGTGPHRPRRIRERQRCRDHVAARLRPAEISHRPGAARGGGAADSALPTDWVFRCNLVTVVDGIMKDHSAGGIGNAEAQRLSPIWRSIDLPGFEFHNGVSYRNLLVYRGSEDSM
jgi:YbgC/YbaW family acyl-CoA thioester hydrolase